MLCRSARQRLPCGSSSWLSSANCMRAENGLASRCARRPTRQRWLTRGDRARPLKETDLEALPIGAIAYPFRLVRKESRSALRPGIGQLRGAQVRRGPSLSRRCSPAPINTHAGLVASPLLRRARSKHHYARSLRDPLIQIHYVGVEHPNAPGRNGFANRVGLIGAVDAKQSVLFVLNQIEGA